MTTRVFIAEVERIGERIQFENKVKMTQSGLTETQKKAVECVSQSVCVSAGAGTGKTNVLVERFCFLIESNFARPREILAITFTERAAQEMKSRIAARLSERGLEEARRELEGAYIGTIHAFSARLLREHPVEAGLDPDFRILEEDEANLLKELSLDELLEARFQEPKVFEILRIYGEENVRESLKSAAADAHSFGIELEKMSKLIAAADGSLIDALKTKALEALKPLEGLKGKEEISASLKQAVQKNISSWQELENLRALAKLFARRGAQKEAISELRLRVDELSQAIAQGLGAVFQETFQSLALDFERRYRRLKAERAALDFNDLEKRCLSLLTGNGLKSEAVLRRCREQFKFVMVDEFQDTSPIQDRLIHLVSKPDNLFIVGDWKQSIYGFRGADASIFLKKEAEFSEGKTGTAISLKENFRSRPELLSEVNRFFETLWTGGENRFQPLTAAREFPAKSVPSVDFLVVEREENENAASGRMKEARAIAEEIARLTSSGTYRFGDFAILFRATTDLFHYEHELRNLRIPYYVMSGRGFYSQPEIRDLVVFLETLDNPHLDIPLAAVLRSPFCGLSDEGLFWLAAHSTRKRLGRRPLYEAVLQSDEIAELASEDRIKLSDFRTLIHPLLLRKERMNPSECLEAILSGTGFERYLLGLGQGKRRFANVKKLLEAAREAERRTSIRLGDFIRYVQGLESQEVRESEAQVEALEGDVVKLLTIHKAKGLQFKVVILPDLNRKGGERMPPFLIDPEHGLGIRVFNEVERDLEDSRTYALIKAKRRRQAVEECKRLLYVGMTRAVDHLILSAPQEGSGNSRTEGSENGNWFARLRKWAEDSNANIRVCEPRSREQACLFPIIAGKTVVRGLPLAQRPKIKAALESGSPISMKPIAAAEKILEQIQPIRPVSFERLDLPVSAYAVYSKDPKAYFSTYELGEFPEEEKNEEWQADEAESLARRAQFGTVLHRVFECLTAGSGGPLQRLPKLVNFFARELEPESRTELEKLCRVFLESEAWRSIRASRKRYAEIPFVLRLKYGIVEGTLDLLYESAGGWVIVDYKTSEITEDKIQEAAARYETQMMLYALACRELLKLPLARADIYFARLGRSWPYSLEGLDWDGLKTRFEQMQEKILKDRKELLA